MENIKVNKITVFFWRQAHKQAYIIVEVYTSNCGALGEGQLTLPGVSGEEMTPEQSFKDG